MSENLLTALQITLVGMGLVFALICLLWGGMALLVRLGGSEAEDAGEERPAPAGPAVVAAQLGDADTDLHALRRRAAAVAVAVAVARRADDAPRAFPLPPTASVSPWQAVRRGERLRSRGRVR